MNMDQELHEQLRRLTSLTAADLGDAMERLGVVDSRIRTIWPGAHLVGRAVTVWPRAGDNLFVHQALELLEPGDVVVVNGQADEMRALVGERMAKKAQDLGGRGFVIDGAVRDVAGLRDLGVPVYARAVTPAGPYKYGPGKINVPIAVGGVVVHPGDVVVGDDDGVVVVPRDQVNEVIERAEVTVAADQELTKTYPPISSR